MAITVEIDSDKDVMTLKLSGSFTFENWPEFHRKCLGIDYPVKLILDFSKLDEINVAGLGMILLLHEKLPQKQNEMVLSACNGQVRKFLDCVGFERWLSGGQGACRKMAMAC